MSVANTVPSIESQLVPILLGNGKEGLKNLVYYQIVTKAVPAVLKGLAIGLRSMFKRRVQKHIEHIANLSVKTKTASVTLQRDYEKGDYNGNMLFDAVLSYISELPQTKHVKRTTTGVFIMSTSEEIEMTSCIFVRKLSETLTDGKITKLSIEVYSYTYDLTTLRKYMDDIEERYMLAMSNQLGKNIFYFDEIPLSLPVGLDRKPDLSKAPPRLMFSKYPLFTNKSLKNIYGDSVKVVRKRVDFFVNNKRWYEEKGVPYTLGLLLHGVPGAGKTSCIKSIAKDTNRHILNIRLSESTTVSQLNALFYSSQVQVTHNGETKFFDIPIDRRIIVLEDIDCLSDVVLSRDAKDVADHEKKATQSYSQDNELVCRTRQSDAATQDRMLPQHPMQTQSQKLNLSILLNILDGVLEQPGRILIMTSNHPEKLDKALIRPGRIDVIVKFDYCKRHEIVEIIEAFTNSKVSKEDALVVADGVFTPAEVSRVIFENIEDLPSIIKSLTVKDEPLVEKDHAHQVVLHNPVYEHKEDHVTHSVSEDKVGGKIEEPIISDVQTNKQNDGTSERFLDKQGHSFFGIQPMQIDKERYPGVYLSSNTQKQAELSLDDFFNSSM